MALLALSLRTLSHLFPVCLNNIDVTFLKLDESLLDKRVSYFGNMSDRFELGVKKQIMVDLALVPQLLTAIISHSSYLIINRQRLMDSFIH